MGKLYVAYLSVDVDMTCAQFWDITNSTFFLLDYKIKNAKYFQ